MPFWVHYNGKLDSIQQDFLSEFSREGERESPLAFVGRESIQNRISERLGRIRNKGAGVSTTQVIQGAPGAGKTSLLVHLQETLDLTDTTVIDLEGENLNERAAVAAAFFRGLSFEVEHDDAWYDQLGKMQTRLMRDPRIWGVIKDSVNVPDDHVVLLLVDEAQRVLPDLNGTTNSVLTSLHSGKTEGLKILPVFAGLSSTIDALFNAGVSRFTERVHNLMPLTPSEAKQVVFDTLSDKRIGLNLILTSEDLNRVATSFQIASEGWPRHLHHYIQGFLREITADFERNPSNERIDLDVILEYGNTERIHYYDERLRAARLDDFYTFLEEVSHQKAQRGEDYGNLSKLDPIFSELDGNTVDEMFNALVHYGILDRDARQSDLHHYPIPSFATYMSCFRDEQRAKQLMSAVYRDQLRLAQEQDEK